MPSRLATRRLLRHKTTPRYEALYTLGVPQALLRQAMCGSLMVVDHTPMPIGRNGAKAVVIVDLPRQPFDGLNVWHIVLSSAVSSTSVRCLLYEPIIFVKKGSDTSAGYLLSQSNSTQKENLAR